MPLFTIRVELWQQMTMYVEAKDHKAAALEARKLRKNLGFTGVRSMTVFKTPVATHEESRIRSHIQSAAELVPILVE